MSINFEIVAKLVAPVIAALIGVIAKNYFEQKPKLISYLVHSSAIPLGEGATAKTVNTHSIVVRNSGKKAAHNVRIGHHIFLPSFQLYPPINHTILKGPNNSAEILIPVLVPNEQVSVSYLYFPPLLWSNINAYTKSDEGMAKIIQVFPSPLPSKIVILMLKCLIFIGASTVIYWAVLLCERILFNNG